MAVCPRVQSQDIPNPPRVPLPITQSGEPLSWQVTQRDFHSETWEAAEAIPNPETNKPIIQRHKFVTLGSGLNFFDEQSQQFKPTVEKFELTPDGFAIAQYGPHKLIVENNINSATALDILCLDGVRLKLGPVGVAWFDPLQQTNYLLATIGNSSPELTSDNTLLFRDCFQAAHFRGSIRVTYRKVGISADLLVHEISDPEILGLSAFTRLELYTELTADSPIPSQTTFVIQNESNDELVRTMESPDLLTDSWLDFGAYKMPTGFGFEVNGNSDRRVRVGKRFMLTPDNRRILIEAVQWQDAKKSFAGISRSRTNELAAFGAGASGQKLKEAVGQTSPSLNRKSNSGIYASPGATLARLVPLRPAVKPVAAPIQQAKAKTSSKEPGS